MHDVKVDKSELLAKVKENRAKHREIFEEALVGYKAEALRQLEAHIERIKNGEVIRVAIQIPSPEDHTNDYDRVIAMLEMSKDDVISVHETDFGAYVMDDWHWKHAFLVSNRIYSATADAALSGR